MDNGLQAAIAAAQAAGKLLRAGFGRAQKVTHKGEIDIVTEADRAAEARIMELLSAAAPGYGFLTEESGAAAGHADGRWIIDPLYGTTNYARGCPRFCVSIALERAGELVLGVIYDPLQGELFVARRGQGATLNGQPIRVSNTNSMARALVSTGYPYDAWTSPRDNTAEAAYMVKHVLSVRCTGSAALDLANVACGRTDAHWEYGLAPYDTAAGVLLVREAGGLASARDHRRHTGRTRRDVELSEGAARAWRPFLRAPAPAGRL